MQSAENIRQEQESEFQQAVGCAQSGDFQRAVALCQGILAKDESFAPAYSLMAEIWKTLGKSENAVTFYGLAAKVDPSNNYYPLEQVKILILAERIEEAYQVLLQSIARFPDVAAFNILLADIHMRMGQHAQALTYLQKAQALGAENVYEHLALCYKAQGLVLQAEEVLLQAKAKHSSNPRFPTTLGDMYTEQKRYEAATENYLGALALDAGYFGAVLGYGNLLMFQKDYTTGLEYLKRASDINPGHPRSYYLMGAYYFNHKDYERASAFMKQSLVYQAEYLPALQMLATALFMLKRKEEALPYIDKVLEKFPDHPSFTHIRAMILGETTDTAPASYVRDLFNEYADRFDEHLVTNLHYAVPQAIDEMFQTIRKEKGDSRNDLSLLDLGCGTGLAAEYFRDCTQHRVGVDLAPLMLEKAKAKNIFQELHVAEVVEYLQGTKASFDIVLAADVLVYFGMLEPFFKAATPAVNPQGYLILSIECSEGDKNFEIMPSGRYKHRPDYVRELGAATGLTLLDYKEMAGRKEHEIDGLHAIYVFYKVA